MAAALGYRTDSSMLSAVLAGAVFGDHCSPIWYDDSVLLVLVVTTSTTYRALQLPYARFQCCIVYWLYYLRYDSFYRYVAFQRCAH
ncbi:hypothetical protein OH492_19525 [Vibrio chagasii]|nr:hypothetical protein [Vibrio chagasii]